jgi:hypothetical protein
MAKRRHTPIHRVITQRLALFGDKEGIRQAIVVQACALLGVAPQLLSGTRMQRHDPRFAKLRLQDVELRWIETELDVGDL